MSQVSCLVNLRHQCGANALVALSASASSSWAGIYCGRVS